MSGLAGVRWFDQSRRATVHEVAAPLNNLAHRGPDGLYAYASGPCALGIAHFITTPEARVERQPYVTAGGLVVTLDGRIDNADELRSALSVSPGGVRSDVAIVAAAWERWGTDTPLRLLGDFALAVWNPRTGELCLARDVFGLRPLTYREHARGFWWASELHALARLGDARVNEGMVAEYLCDAVRSETETLVAGVLRVPRASVLTCSEGGVTSIRRYWTPAAVVPTHRPDGEAVEEFRSIFSEAVRVRLRSDRPVAILLSGGLDSSLIAAEAASLARVKQGPGVSCFTLASPGDPSDESPYAQCVAQHVGLSSTLWPYQDAALAPIIQDAERGLDMPMAPNCVAALPLTTGLHAGQTRVCVNGVGGNEWFSGNHFPFADHVRNLQFMRMARRMWAYRQADASYRPYSDLRLAVWLQLPESAKQLARAFKPDRTPGWMTGSFADRIGLSERVRARLDVPDFPTVQQRLMFAWATNADKMFFTEYTERVNAWLQSEERMPFLDRRVAEWALTLPDDQRWRDGRGKVILRNAAAAVLPPAVVRREQGPDFSSQTADGLRQIGGRELVLAIARERGDWVRPDAIAAHWDAMCEAQRCSGQRLGYFSWLLWLLVGTHLAARAIETIRPGTIHHSFPELQEIVV